MDSDGEKVEGEQTGLLLHKGGTVCDNLFDRRAAEAICRRMGYGDVKFWTNDRNFDTQDNYDIYLDDVACHNETWESCSFSEDHSCTHRNDVFLNCYAAGADFSLLLFLRI